MEKTSGSRSRRGLTARRASGAIEPLESRRMLALVGPEDVAAALASLSYRGSDATIRIAGDDSPTADTGLNLTQSTSRIGLDQLKADARFAGIDGSGFAIAVLDTGADLDHPAFGPDGNGDGRADRIVYSWDFADQDSDAQDLNSHGTNVASIAAGVNGVAPGADLIVLKVVDDSGFGQFGDVEAALQWVVANVATYNIAAVNLSLSDNTNRTAATGDYGLEDEFSALASLGVVVASAAGNVYGPASGQGVGYPAADPNSLAIGATWDTNVGGPQNWSSGSIDFTTGADRLTSFSQRHSTLTDLFAPGAWITGAGLNGGSSTFAGTSQATPHVAGAVALAQQLAERELGRLLTVQEVRNELVDSGRAIADGDDEDDNVVNTGLSFSLLNVYQMAQAIMIEGTIHVEGSAPAAGAIVSNPPSSYVIHFSEPPDLATLAAGDFRVNGLPASSVMMVDSDSAEFRFNVTPVTAEGAQTMEMAAGALRNRAGKDSAAFSTLFRYDALRMSLSSSDPPIGQTVALPLAELRFVFNEAILPASVQSFDLWIDAGTVTSAQLIDSKTLAFGVSGLTHEGAVAWSLTAGAVTDTYGNPSVAASGAFTLDVNQLAIDAPQVETPLFAGDFRSLRSGLLQTTSDVDGFLVSLETGQRLSVLLESDATLRAAVDLYDATGALAQSLSASAPGADVLLNGYQAASNGTYRVAVRGQSGSQGAYDLQFTINSALESELYGGVSNDAPSGAQNLNSAFVSVASNAAVATVAGTTDAEVTKLGPDGFGYEAVVVPFEFIDVSATGTPIFAAGADNWWTRLTQTQLAGFTFNYYGTTYSDFYVDTNAHITFGLEDSNPSNTDLTLNPFMATIAVLWDDLVMDTSAGSSVYLQVLGSGASQQLVLQWNKVKFNGASDHITFQVVLSEATGAIQFNYLDLDSANPASGGARATVGIKDVDFQVPPQGLRRLLVSYNSGPNDFVGSGRSVRIAVGVTQPTPPDYYSLTLTAGQATTLGISGREYGDVDIELLNAAGTVVATSTAAIEPARVIRDFKATTSGTYYVRVTGDAGVDYALQVSRGAAIDAEPNDAPGAAQSITPTGVVNGALGYGYTPPSVSGTARTGPFDVQSTPLALGFTGEGAFGGPTKGVSYAGIEYLKVGTLVSTYTVSLGGVNYTNGAGGGSLSAFPVTMIEFGSGGQHSVRITGTIVPGVIFERVVTWTDGDAHALVTTRIVNQTTGAIANVALLENQDPDPGTVLVTHNDVAASGDLATAWSAAGSIALGSLDPRAVVSSEGFINTNPFDILDSPNDPNDTTGDIALNVAFRYGTLAAGASVSSTFAIVVGATPDMTANTFDAIALETLPASDDYYSIAVVAGNALSLSTQTPGDGNSGLNALDPVVELYNASGALVATNDNGAADGRNAKLTHTAQQTGTYTIRVRANADTSGVYTLVAKGYTGSGAPSPANQAPIADAGGPYVISEGQGVTFNGSGTFDPDAGDTLTYRWDLDGDGAFDDGTGLIVSLTWSQLLALGIDGRSSPFTIRLQVDDAHAHQVVSPAAYLIVNNTAPTVTLSVPGGPIVRSFSESFSLSVSDPSPGDQAANFTYEFDWNGDGVFDQTVVGASQISAPWTFSSKGLQNVRVRASDRDGGRSVEVVKPVDVQAWAVIDQADGPAVLRVGGTSGDDLIVLGDVAGDPNGLFAVLVTPQETRMTSLTFSGEIEIAGGDGNDTILVSALASRAATLLGGAGNDLLVGGAGGDVLLGGVGNDLLFGGRGGDLLFGEEGEDLLIAGRTTFDWDMAALNSLRYEWTSARSYSTRIANLTGVGTGPRANGNYFLTPGSNVFDDSGVDQVSGGSGTDWLWSDTLEDALLDWVAGEIVQDLHNYPDGGHSGGGGQSL